MTLAGRLDGTLDGARVNIEASGRDITIRCPVSLAAINGLRKSRRGGPHVRRIASELFGVPDIIGLRVRVKLGPIPVGGARL